VACPTPEPPGKENFSSRSSPASCLFFFSSLALNTGRILLGRRKRRRRRSFLSAGDERERGGEAKGGESGWEMGATCSFSTYWSTSESARGRGTNDSDRPLSAGCDPPATGEQMTGGTHGVTWPRVAADAAAEPKQDAGRFWMIEHGGPAPCARGPCPGPGSRQGRRDKKEPRRPLETAWGRIADKRERGGLDGYR
jgi:hypothetical protein